MPGQQLDTSERARRRPLVQSPGRTGLLIGQNAVSALRPPTNWFLKFLACDHHKNSFGPLDAAAVGETKRDHRDPSKSILCSQTLNWCTLQHTHLILIQINKYSQWQRYYTNSDVDGQMNACMTFQSSSIMFGLNVFVTLPKVFCLWFGKWIMHW